MLAHLLRRQGRLDEAEALYRVTIVSWQEQGHQSAVAHQLECFAYIALAREQWQRAAALLGAANRTRERLQAPSTDVQEIAELEDAMRRLDEYLEPNERRRAFGEGSLMTLDDAVSYALGA
jgi:hypothetical protein